MKLFETPVIEVIELKIMDVIATSNGGQPGSEECPVDMGEF